MANYYFDLLERQAREVFDNQEATNLINKLFMINTSTPYRDGGKHRVPLWSSPPEYKLDYNPNCRMALTPYSTYIIKDDIVSPEADFELLKHRREAISVDEEEFLAIIDVK